MAAAAPAANVVLGAGGPTGLCCVRRLLEATETPVRAVVRDPAKHQAALEAAAADLSPGASARLEVVAGDVTDPDSLPQVLRDAAGVIFAASGKGYWSAEPVDHMGVVNVVNAIQQAAGSGGGGGGSGPAPSRLLPHVVLVSSMLTDPANRFHPVRLLLNNIRWGLMDAKWAGERALAASGLPFTVVRPGGLNNGPAGGGTLLAEVGAAKESLMGSISRADVAAVCVEALRNAAAANKTLSIVTQKGSASLAPGDGLARELQRLFASFAAGGGGGGGGGGAGKAA